MKDLMNAKLFLNNTMWCTVCICSNSSKNNPEKNFVILPNIECTMNSCCKPKKKVLFLRMFIYVPIIFKKFVSIKVGHYNHNYFTHRVPRKENFVDGSIAEGI